MQFFLNPTKVTSFSYSEISESYSILEVALNSEELFADITKHEDEETFMLRVPPAINKGANNYEYRYHNCDIQALDRKNLTLVLFSSLLTTHNVNEVRKTKIEGYLSSND
jgi:hypothetical protein